MIMIIFIATVPLGIFSYKDTNESKNVSGKDINIQLQMTTKFAENNVNTTKKEVDIGLLRSTLHNQESVFFDVLNSSEKIKLV